MIRTLKIISVFTVIGVLSTIATAWACATWSQPRAFDAQVLASIRREFFQREAPDSNGRKYWPAIAYPGFGALFCDLYIDEPDQVEDSNAGPFPAIGLIRTGWPWPALEAQWERDASRSPTSGPEQKRGILLQRPYIAANRLYLPRLLPIQPLWSGFAADVVVFGLGFWLVWALVIISRRRLRIWRHRCPMCAYPVGSSPVCTECGHRLKARVAKLSV